MGMLIRQRSRVLVINSATRSKERVMVRWEVDTYVMFYTEQTEQTEPHRGVKERVVTDWLSACARCFPCHCPTRTIPLRPGLPRQHRPATRYRVHEHEHAGAYCSVR